MDCNLEGRRKYVLIGQPILGKIEHESPLELVPNKFKNFPKTFFSATGEDHISNLMGIDLRTLESAYAYMQSMLIPSFASFHQSIVGSSSTNDFFHKEQPIVLDEQLEPQEHGRVRQQPVRNTQPPRCGTYGHMQH
ncbi:hypothetical protein JHK86_000708 [Glycine max]|nr:hypothetical protein JHK86_000708 [Glycine max]